MSDNTINSTDELRGGAEQVAECNEFISQLKVFHQNLGTTLLAEPLQDSQKLDLLRLYRFVTTNGGYQVFNDRNCWNAICQLYNLPTTSVNFVANIKGVYMKYLSGFEDARRLARQITAKNNLSSLPDAAFAQQQAPNAPAQTEHSETPTKSVPTRPGLRPRKAPLQEMSVPDNSFLATPTLNQNFKNPQNMNAEGINPNRGNFINLQSKQFQLAQNAPYEGVAPLKINPSSKSIPKTKINAGSQPAPASSHTPAAANESIGKLETLLSGHTLNVLDFFGGPGCKIVLSLSSGLPNEIELAISQLLKFSTYCNEDYSVKDFAPFLVDQLVNLLEICRNNFLDSAIAGEESSPKASLQDESQYPKPLCAELEFSEDEFLSDYVDDHEESRFLIANDLVYQNGPSSQKFMYEQLALDLVLILRNLAIASTKNASYFNEHSFLLEEVGCWLEPRNSFLGFGTESKILFLELLETVVSYAKDAELLKYTRFWDIFLKEFLESNDQYLVLLAARYISSFWLKTGFSSLNGSHSNLKLYSDNVRISSIVSRCLGILVAGGESEIELQETSAYLLISVVIREVNQLHGITEQNDRPKLQPWVSSLGFQFDQQIMSVIKLQYNVFKMYTQGSTSGASELLHAVYGQKVEFSTSEYHKIIICCHSTLNSMFKIIIELLNWAEEFRKFKKHSGYSSKEAGRVLSPSFHKEAISGFGTGLGADVDTSVDTDIGFDTGTAGENTGKGMLKLGISKQENTLNKLQIYAKLYLNNEVRTYLSEVAIHVPTVAAKQFLSLFRM